MNGYAAIARTWKAGDRIELELPMAVQRVHASEKIAATAGKVALRYGPLVYNIEQVDQDISGALASIGAPDDGMAPGSAGRRHGDQRHVRRRNAADRDPQLHALQPHAAIATATAVASGCAAPCAATANLDRLDSRSLSLTRSPMSIRVAVIALTLLLQQLPPPFHSPWFRKPLASSRCPRRIS